MTSIGYRLRSLEFRNGRARDARKIGFRAGRMLFNAPDRLLAVDQLATPAAEIDRIVSVAMHADGAPAEIMAIRYEIEIGDLPALPMCHPLQEGARVYLLPRERGQRESTIFLRQADGRPFFSREWSVGDLIEHEPNNGPSRVLALRRAIAAGKVDARAPIYQFHGFRHEH